MTINQIAILSRAYRFLFAGLLAITLAAAQAEALDQGISGKKLLLKSNGKLVLLSKDFGISIAGSDPLGGPDSSITFDDGNGPVTYTLPAGSNWGTNGSVTLYKYKNTAAPGGPSPVKIVKLKSGLLKVIATALPFPVPFGAATINVVLSLAGGTNTYCMAFSGTGDGNRFLVKDVVPGNCVNCGDNDLDVGEVCDGTALDGETCVTQGFDEGALSCAGNCQSFNSSQCATCGDNVTGGTEQCDGADDEACPGLCTASCVCNPPCETNTGGFCWFRSDLGDSCDTTCANAGRFYDSATATFAGSEGTYANCAQLSSDFGNGNFLWSDGPCSTGSGCRDGGLSAFYRCSSPATSSSAAEPGYYRICACQDVPEAPCEATTGGFCWFLGEDGESCDFVCAAAERVYDPATQIYAGSLGTNAHCLGVLTDLGAPGSTVSTFGSSVGVGCSYFAGAVNERYRVASPTTSASAAGSIISRACACQ